jgi:putative hydrolase of the HAD superfamily
VVLQTSDIKAVVLDIDGTLCSLTKGVGEIYAEVLQARGLPSDPATLSTAARDEWRSFQDSYLNTAHHHQTTHHREREVWLDFVRGVFTRAGLPYGASSEVVTSIYDAFASGNFRCVERGVIEFLEKAHAAGLSLVAASNNDDRSKITLRELGIAEHLNGIFVAGDLGWKKPSPHFFKAVESHLNMGAGQLLHIGNNYRLDVEAARRCGWSAVLYDPKGGGQQPSVRSFHELVQLLGC